VHQSNSLRPLNSLQLGAIAFGSYCGSAWCGATDEAVARSEHFPFAPVVPARPVPALPVVAATMQQTDLATLLLGHVSALQLMFIRCSATCPIQGALFAPAQR
jgi:protein SCO1/2